MTYKGYTARMEFDAEDRIFVGHVLGIRDLVGFHGDTVDQLEQAFRETLDDYLEACEKLGQEPDKPYSGRILLRLPPELHAAVATAAAAHGKSINQWATEILSTASHQ